MKMFKSLDEVKAVAEKFEAGKIVPARILKGTSKRARKSAHHLKFSIDVYRLSGVYGNVLVCDFDGYNIDYAIIFDARDEDNLEFKGSPYRDKNQWFVGNIGIDSVTFLSNINKYVFGKTAAEV